jgi:hypothetical protein
MLRRVAIIRCVMDISNVKHHLLKYIVNKINKTVWIHTYKLEKVIC